MILPFIQGLVNTYLTSTSSQNLREICPTIYNSIAAQNTSSNAGYIVFNVLPGNNAQTLCKSNLYTFDVRFDVYSNAAGNGMAIAESLLKFFDNRYFEFDDGRIVRVRPIGPIYNRYDAGDRVFVHSFVMEYFLQEQNI